MINPTNKPTLLVAIPCLNEENTIEEVIDNIFNVLNPLKNKKFNDFKVLVIDDGSTDKTVELSKSKGAYVFSHTHNRGVGIAFKTAVEYFLKSSHHLMVNMDGDNQFSAADIPKLIDPILDEKADFVSGSRFKDPKNYPQMPWIKFWGNQRMSKLVSRLSSQEFYDVSCGFRAYNREALLNLNLLGQFTYTQETFLDFSFKGLRILEVPIQVTYFPDRQSRVVKSIRQYAFKTFLILFRAYRDYRPLRFFWGIGLFLFIIGCGFASILLMHRLQTGRFSGHIWAGATGGFFIINAIIFFILGVVTDMLDRVRVNQERILYTLKKYFNNRL